MNDLKPTVPLERLPLPASFFCRDTVSVARELIGCLLMRFDPAAGQWLSYRVVETEAYTADDPACHAYNRTTGRAKMLYADPGTAYVYLIYGMYNCLNVVTEPQGVAGAVLFRALEPRLPEGYGGKYADPAALRTNGPGRLAKALDIDCSTFNGVSLTQAESGLYLAKGEEVPDDAMTQTTRIGITKAVDYPWRFYIRDNAWVSVKAPEDLARNRLQKRAKQKQAE